MGLMGTETQDVRRRVHPTQKPVEVCEWFIERFSDENDIIADPFLGSGTTMIAAEKLGRRAYGIEIEPQYVDVAVKRWEQMTGKTATLKATGQPFSE